MRIRPALVLPLSLSLALPAFAAQDIDKVNGSITVEAGQEAGDLSTVNGSIKIGAGARTGKAETVNGSITVAENVTAGGLETVNGSIRVSGNGKLSMGPSAIGGVLGLSDLAGFDEVRLYAFDSASDSSGFSAPAIDSVRGFTIPEPGSLALASLAGLAVLGTRRRRR